MTLLTFEEALQKVDENTSTLPVVQLPLSAASGRRLASAVFAKIDLPRFDNSQMDGYAVRSDDLAGASAHGPVVLTVVGVSPAGLTQEQSIVTGQTVKIFTGAPLPSGADAVAPIEDVLASPDGCTVTFSAPTPPGEFIRLKGEDVSVGTAIGAEYDVLTAGRLALLLSSGHGEAAVFRQAKVVILANGDELAGTSIRPEDLSHGQIYESNGVMLAALVKDAGAAVVASVSTSDSRSDIVREVEEILTRFTPDLIISTGGVSVGDRDFIRSVIEELGEIVFWRSAIRPGKPILYGKLGRCHFLGLPGNPASTLVTFELFARPLIEKLHGGHCRIHVLPTTLGAAVSHGAGRRSFVRAVTKVTKSGLVSVPAGGQGSHFVTSLARANSLIVMNESVKSLNEGSQAECVLTGPLESE